MHIIEGKQQHYIYNLDIKLRLYVKQYMIYNGTKNVENHQNSSCSSLICDEMYGL